jgi:hypothetical protein
MELIDLGGALAIFLCSFRIAYIAMCKELDYNNRGMWKA